MKIKGKEIKEYSKEYINGLITRKVPLDLEKDLEESLDDLVLTLQTHVYEMEKSRKLGIPVFIETQLMYHHQASAYLNVIEEINKKFGTKYSRNVEKIIKHFETKTPAKD